MANPLGIVDRREIASASTISAWHQSFRNCATVDFPLPIPPVIPSRITSRMRLDANPVPSCACAHNQRHKTGTSEKRAEGDVSPFTQFAIDFEGNANNCTND